ncbi:MAG TPA: RNA polymerase sigma-70 factor [Agriterribacter sp.]|nr:RNA polymerase sigma-70 factor [Agriterribacter sp.]
MTAQPTHTDKELFALIAEGDEHAFEKLFDSYVPRIQPVILQIVKSETVAKDIVQDIFLGLWLNRVRLVDVEQPKNYIFRIVYNQSFKYLQKLIVRQKAASVFEAERSSVSMEHALDLTEIRRMIELAIQKLPSQSRQIYYMNRIAGYKPQEIANQLDISVQSVRNSLTRSGKAIRSYLEKNRLIIPAILLALLLQ